MITQLLNIPAQVTPFAAQGMTLETWLELNSLSEYTTAFREKGYTTRAAVLEITEEHLVECGVSKVSHKKHFHAVLDASRNAKI
jgi:hypothetical protein